MTPRVGLVGTGSMGLTHLRAWRTAQVEPVGVAALRPESARAFAAEHGLAAFDSVDELMGACDAVDLCVPTDLHARLTLRAAEHGRDVVCEKPLARTVEEGRAMIEACRQHGVLLLVAQVLRYFPTYRRAFELVEAGKIGALTRVDLQRASAVPPHSWYRDAARSGGLVLDLLVHDVDFACWLLGAPAEVRREPLVAPGEHPGGERARLHLRWPSGATGVIEGSWNLPEATTHFRLEGTGGMLRGDGGRLTFVARDRPNDPVAVEVERQAPFGLMAMDLAAALRRESTFVVRPEDALVAVDVCTRGEFDEPMTGAPVIESATET